MATEKHYLDLTGLTLYDQLIKGVIKVAKDAAVSAQTRADEAMSAATSAITAVETLSGNVNTALAGKADKVHTHQQSEISGLTQDLANRYTKSEADGKFQLLSNLTQVIGASSTDAQYPSAKAVHEAISGVTSGLEPRVAALESGVTHINSLIPAAATSANTLADKEFVNSSIATATATFRGTWHITSDLGLPAVSGESWDAVAQKLNTFTGITEANKNDYTFVYVPGHDAMISGETRHIESRFDRYKYTEAVGGGTWEYEYSLNNSSFTAAQWDAINSNITAGKVEGYDAHINNHDIHVTAEQKTAWTAKADISDITSAVSALSATVTTELAKKSDTGHTHQMSEVSGLTEALSAITTDLSNVYTKTEIDGAHLTISKAINALNDGKADKATTLAGYGITDATIAADATGSTITLGSSSVKVYSTAQVDAKIADITSITEQEIRGLFS